MKNPFRFRVLLSCLGAALAWFLLGVGDWMLLAIIALPLAALGFGVGYIADNISAVLGRASLSMTTHSHGRSMAAPDWHAFHQELCNKQLDEEAERHVGHSLDDLNSASLSLSAHGYNPNRANGQKT